MRKKKKKDKSDKKEKTEEKNDDKKKVNKNEEHCRHFLKGSCRHGFLGKNPNNGIQKCPYLHPMVCKKYMNYGRNTEYGCQGDCNLVHVKMCRESLEGKECSKIGDRKRCPYGYHIKQRKSDRKDENRNMGDKNVSGDRIESSMKFDRESLKFFFGEIMREESVRLENKMEDMVIRKMSMFPPPPVRTPPVVEKTSREKEFFSLMKNMMSHY